MTAALRCLSDQELSDTIGPRCSLPPHAATCPSCRARREVLARAPALLRRWEVAELSDQAVARTGAALLTAVERERGTSGLAPWMMAAAAGLLVVAGAALSGWWLMQAPSAALRGQVIASSEDARIEHTLTRLEPTQAGSELEEEVVRLRGGQVRLSVAPLSIHQRFRVVTGDGEVEVRGTLFEVRVEADRLTSVRVDEGVVVVRVGAEAAVWLRAGEAWEREDAGAASGAGDGAGDGVREASGEASGAGSANGGREASEEEAVAQGRDSGLSSAPARADAARVEGAEEVAPRGDDRRQERAPRSSTRRRPSSAHIEASPTEARAASATSPSSAPAASRAAPAGSPTSAPAATALAPAPAAPAAPATPSPSAPAPAAPAAPATPSPSSPAPAAPAPAAPAPAAPATPSPSAPAVSPSAPSPTAPAPIATAVPPAPAVDLAAAQTTFREAWSLLRAGAHRDAARAFATTERLAGTDPLATDAGYWRAMALVQAEADSAEAALRSFLARYPRSPRTAAIGILLADHLIATDRRREARTLLLEIAEGADAARAFEARARLEKLPR